MVQSIDMLAVNKYLAAERIKRFPGLQFAQNMYSPEATDELIAVRIPNGAIFWANAIYRKVTLSPLDSIATIANNLLVDEAKILDYAARYGSHDDTWFAMIDLWHYLNYPDGSCVASTTMALFRIASDNGLDILKELADAQQFVLVRDNEIIHAPEEHKRIVIPGVGGEIAIGEVVAVTDQPEFTEQLPAETDRMTGFEKALEHLINTHSMENGSDTPDFLLAQYLRGCLENFNTVVKARSRWYGRPNEMNASLGLDQPLNNPDDPIGTEA
jgi:hypothetical protein